MNPILSLILLAISVGHISSAQTEYFIGVNGDDANAGTSPAVAFGTLQRGVNALEAGDTLTILPGEYLGSARRVGIGGDESETVIRAKIPGTVKIRGDIPGPVFEKVDGYRYVYAADVSGDIQGVNEICTLRPLRRTTFIADLDFAPGLYFHDEEAGRLYISSSDRQSPADYIYTLSVIGDHGLWLRGATKVLVEGIDFVGFQQPGEANMRDQTGRVTYGVFIVDGTECVIRNCRAYFNNRGIGFNAQTEDYGRNVIEHCKSWANWRHGIGSSGGGLTLLFPNHCEIRHSEAFLNDGIGILIYQHGSGGRQYRNLAWGNQADIQLKSRGAIADRVVGVGPWGGDSIHARVEHSLIGRISSEGELFSDNITLQNLSQPRDHRDYGDLRAEDEFVDAVNHDYRLQSTSRFIGAASDDSDPGPFPFEGNVYFVSPQGDDEADGLSVSGAWKSLEQASAALSAGDTLYLLPGHYDGRVVIADLTSSLAEPLRIRGHGHGPAVLREGLHFVNCQHVEIERIQMDSPLEIEGGGDFMLRNSVFRGQDIGVALLGTDSVKIDHCEFGTGDGPRLQARESTNLFLTGNVFDNSSCPAISLDSTAGILFLDNNSYLNGERVAMVEGVEFGGNALPNNWESHGNFGQRGLGLYARHAGVYNLAPTVEVATVRPVIHSVAATTANFEWESGGPGIYTVEWGESEKPDGQHRQVVIGKNLTTFSLTGLKPETSYYFRIVEGEIMTTSHEGMENEVGAIPVDDRVLEFSTAAINGAGRDFHVRVDGDNWASGLSPSEAWASLNQAAARVGPGDTVWVGEGVYRERVIVRASGSEDAPITFRAMPGAKVVFDSGSLLLGYFVVDYKDHIHLDGFHFNGMMRHGPHRMFPGAAVRARQANNLKVSRCIMNGRTILYSGSFGAFFESANVTLSNCVQIDNMSSLLVVDCSDFVIENCVFLRPKISPLTLINRPGQSIVIRDTLFTDSLPNKANSLLISLGRHDTLELDNIGLFFRKPAEDRFLLGIYGDIAYERAAEAFGMSNLHKDPYHQTIDEIQLRVTAVEWYRDYAEGSERFVEGDPGFAFVVANQEVATESVNAIRERRPTTQYFDWLTTTNLRRGEVYEYSDFFVTNPNFTDRSIGLDPAAFD